MNIELLNAKITAHYPITIVRDYTIRGGLDEKFAQRVIDAREMRIKQGKK